MSDRRRKIERLRALARSTTFPAERDNANAMADRLEAQELAEQRARHDPFDLFSRGARVSPPFHPNSHASPFGARGQTYDREAALDDLAATMGLRSSWRDDFAKAMNTAQNTRLAAETLEAAVKASGARRCEGIGGPVWLVPGIGPGLTDAELVERYAMGEFD